MHLDVWRPPVNKANKEEEEEEKQDKARLFEQI